MTDLSGQTKSCAPDCNFNKYSAFRTSEKQPPLISDQRPISRSHLAQNTYIRLSTSDQRPHLLKIWETAATCKLTKKKKHITLLLQYPILSGTKKVFAKSRWKFDSSISIFIWRKIAGNNMHRTASATRKNHLACYQNKDWCGLLPIPTQTIPLFWKIYFTENCISSSSKSLSK